MFFNQVNWGFFGGNQVGVTLRYHGLAETKKHRNMKIEKDENMEIYKYEMELYG